MSRVAQLVKALAAEPDGQRLVTRISMVERSSSRKLSSALSLHDHSEYTHTETQEIMWLGMLLKPRLPSLAPWRTRCDGACLPSQCQDRDWKVRSLRPTWTSWVSGLAEVLGIQQHSGPQTSSF